MIRFIVAFLLSLALPFSAAAQSVVRGEWIALRDVAPVEGEAGDILLGPAPPPGQTLALDPAFVIAVARKSGIALALPLDSPLWVKREAARPAPVAPMAASAPVARTASRASAAEGVLAGGRPSGDVLILTRDLKRGDVIREDDIAWGPAPTGRIVRNAAPSIDRVVGQSVRRSLVVGAAVELSDLEAPDLVRKGDAVTLIYATPGMRLTVAGQAQADGGLGDTVRILNLQSRRSIDATVSGPAQASVQSR